MLDRKINLKHPTEDVNDRVNYMMNFYIHSYLVTKSYGIVTLVHLSDIYIYANDENLGQIIAQDVLKAYTVVDEIVDKNIEIGFHSHNNMQLSLALSMQFIKCLSDRNILVDSSLCGIGRGAGNTQTELLVEYLNKNGSNYQTEFVWDCIKKHIAPLHKEYRWGYTPQMGLKGIKGLHPNTQSEW